MSTDLQPPVIARADTRRHARVAAGASAVGPSAVPRSSRAEAGTPLEGLQGAIAPPKISALYRLGLAAVLVLLVLLPLVYLALTAGVAWLTWWHATHNNWLLMQRAGRAGNRVNFALYVTPIVIGIVMGVFMIKPILARAAKGPDPVVVRPDQEPLLFAFIARICRVLKAPIPSEVALDCQVNASASFRRGIWSFGSNDLTLTIGVPLVAGLTLRELAGVLAHELGHFAQGAGMRATYLIRSINGWFARVVFERDAWDMWLDRAANVDFRLTLLVRLTQAGIWANRKVLQGLMMVGHAGSCFMLRQMEYDADRYEIELAGTDTFISTSEKLPVLSLALMQALEDARNGWRAKRLPDDLPALMMHRDALISSRDRGRLLDHQRSQTTGSLDTHPSMADRVAAAKRLARPGLFRRETAATELFRDFTASSRAVTRQYYESVSVVAAGEDVASIMVATSHMATDGTAAHEATNAFEAFSGSALSPYRPLTLGSVDSLAAASAASAPDAIRARFRTAFAAMQAVADQARASNVAFHESLKARHLAQRAGILINAGAKLSAEEWRLPEATTAGVQRALKTIEARIDKHKPVLLESDRQVQAALVAALELIAREPSLAGYRDELPRLLPAFMSVSTALEDLIDISVYGAVLQQCVASAQEHGELSDQAAAFLMGLAEVIEPMLERIDAACADVRYPFDTATGDVTLRQYLYGHDLPDDRMLSAMVRATRLVDVLPDLYVRLLGRFAQMALAIETPTADDADTTEGPPATN